MKKEQSQLYLAAIYMTSINPWDDFRLYTLCDLCTYYHITEYDAECRHQLESVYQRQFDKMYQGQDCWAFRPQYKIFTDMDIEQSALRLVAQGNVSKRHEPDSVYKCALCDKELSLRVRAWGLLCMDCWDYWVEVRIRLNKKYSEQPLNFSGVTTGRFKINDSRS
jgi:hypothetical protein